MQILILVPRAQDRAPDGAVVRVHLLPEPCMWTWEICDPRGEVIDSGWASEWAAYDSAEEAYAAGEERRRTKIIPKALVDASDCSSFSRPHSEQRM